MDGRTFQIGSVSRDFFLKFSFMFMVTKMTQYSFFFKSDNFCRKILGNIFAYFLKLFHNILQDFGKKKKKKKKKNPPKMGNLGLSLQ